MRVGRAVQLCVALVGLRAAPAHADVLLADDFETGTLLQQDSPPGPWAMLAEPVAGNTAQASSAAAHRGQYGLRVVDTVSTGSRGGDASVYSPKPLAGRDIYIRTWMRMEQTNGQGAASAVMVQDSSGDTLARLELSGQSASSVTLALPGSSVSGWQNGDFNFPLATGGWHLVEVNLKGLGTATGARELWLDGALVGSTTPDWSGIGVNVVAVGEPWSEAPAFTGTLDLDDVRISTAPNASKLALALGANGSGSCAPLQVSLRSSDGALAPTTPYDVQVTLHGADGRLYTDAGCRNALAAPAQVTIPARQSVAALYVSASSAAVTLLAEHPDFLAAAPLVVPPGTFVKSIYTFRGCSAAGGAAGLWPAWLGLWLLRRRRRRGPGLSWTGAHGA